MDVKNIEAIDLFCGIGGLSCGLLQAGIKVKAGLDSDSSCKYAYEKNIQAEFIEADIANYDLNKLHTYYSENSIKVLVGCAPCQPFSSHTHKTKKDRQSDQRWNLIDYFAKATEILKPDFISMENVRGLIKTDIFQIFVEKLESLGYCITYKIVFCPHYGIPQNRYRLVLTGGLNTTLAIPKPTHTNDQYTTVKDAIGNLPKIQAGETSVEDAFHKAKGMREINIKRIQQSKPGGTWRDWDKELLPNCYRKDSGQTYTSVYGRMFYEAQSPTITTQFFNYGSGRFGHPEQDRGLSIREGAVLQTFPIDYDFGQDIAIATLGRHIGNAVPPRLGEVIGNQIMKNIGDNNG